MCVLPQKRQAFSGTPLEKYTLECRVFGQAKRAQTRCECPALTKPIEILAISMESVATQAGEKVNRPYSV